MVYLRLVMAKRPATDVFHDWALVGKDEGMEKGHAFAVNEMLDFIFKPVSYTHLTLPTMS